MAKILVVDDSDLVRSQVVKCLHDAKHEAVTAENGRDGLAKFSSHPDIQLIIADVNMPEMDGLTMCEKLLAMGKGKAPPIFMLTTEFSSDLKARGKAAGVIAWLTKPFEPKTLLAAIAKVLRL